jgi:hypothetical protein
MKWINKSLLGLVGIAICWCLGQPALAVPLSPACENKSGSLAFSGTERSLLLNGVLNSVSGQATGNRWLLSSTEPTVSAGASSDESASFHGSVCKQKGLSLVELMAAEPAGSTGTENPEPGSGPHDSAQAWLTSIDQLAPEAVARFRPTEESLSPSRRLTEISHPPRAA